MTWTEGTIQICDTIIIGGGYWGILSFSVFVLLMVAITIFFSLSFRTLLSFTLKDLK